MNMTKPGIFSLSGEAKNFVFDNMAAFKHHLMVILPLVLVLEAVNQAGKVMQIGWVPVATLLPVMILYAIFSLAWYRASLLGAHESYSFKRIPDTLKEWKFVAIFIALAAFFFVLMSLLKIGMQNFVAAMPEVKTVHKITGMAGAFLIFVIMVRVSYIMPARALGTDLGWHDWGRAAKGTMRALLGSLLILILLFSVLMIAYTFLVGAVVLSVAGETAPQGFGAAFLGFVLSIPIYIGVLLFAAVCITAISRAYQWGMAHNPV